MADALTRLGISVAADGDYNWGDVSGGVNSVNTALQAISSRGMWTGVDNPGTYSISGLLTFTGSGGVSGNLPVTGGGTFGGDIAASDAAVNLGSGGFGLTGQYTTYRSNSTNIGYVVGDHTASKLKMNTFTGSTLSFGTEGVERMTLDNAGNLDVTGEISASVPEGTFTPSFTFSGGSVTYLIQKGFYRKLANNCVHIVIYISINSTSTPTGDLTITGLPFTQDPTAEMSASLTWGVQTFSTNTPTSFVEGNSIKIYRNGTVTPVDASELQAPGFYLISGIYYL